jgi:hypothetical protein
VWLRIADFEIRMDSPGIAEVLGTVIHAIMAACSSHLRKATGIFALFLAAAQLVSFITKYPTPIAFSFSTSEPVSTLATSIFPANRASCLG